MSKCEKYHETRAGVASTFLDDSRLIFPWKLYLDVNRTWLKVWRAGSNVCRLSFCAIYCMRGGGLISLHRSAERNKWSFSGPAKEKTERAVLHPSVGEKRNRRRNIIARPYLTSRLIDFYFFGPCMGVTKFEGFFFQWWGWHLSSRFWANDF